MRLSTQGHLLNRIKPMSLWPQNTHLILKHCGNLPCHYPVGQYYGFPFIDTSEPPRRSTVLSSAPKGWRLVEPGFSPRAIFSLRSSFLQDLTWCSPPTWSQSRPSPTPRGTRPSPTYASSGLASHHLLPQLLPCPKMSPTFHPNPNTLPRSTN